MDWTEDDIAADLRELAQEYWPGATTLEVEDDPPGFTIECGEQRFRIRVVQL